MSAHPLPRQPQAGFLARTRYQVLAGIVLAVLIPLAGSMLLLHTTYPDPYQAYTAIGSALALVGGYLAARRLHVFPGIAAGGYIVACLCGSYGALAIIFVLLRLDYSRVQMSISFGLTLAFFIFVHLKITSRRTRIIGVIPGGSAKDLPAVPKVCWIDLKEGVAYSQLDAVIADLRHDHSKFWDDMITEFALNGTPVFHVKQATEQLTGRVELEHLSENTLGSLNPNDVYLKIKSAVDIITALAMVVLLAPVLIVVGIAVRFDSPGPALFRQRRVGFRSTIFTVYKFRTMRAVTAGTAEDAHQLKLRAITREKDPRITRIGGFLRRSRLDELPQLFNVIRGEMSLIGPRPEAEALSEWYADELSFYRYRHIIKPGITGWAQINQGHVAEVDEVREKLHLDFYYIKNFSVWLDILIFLRTVHTMITGFGSR